MSTAARLQATNGREPMKTIYLYVLATMADWEVGYAIAELNPQRYRTTRQNWRVTTCAGDTRPIRTLRGMTIQPDCALDTMRVTDAAMLILPGADIWMTPQQAPVLARAGPPGRRETRRRDLRRHGRPRRGWPA
jgi:hypothetical protein